MFLVIGLGNPGTRYIKTRHNIGFLVIDRLARRMGIRTVKAEHHALTGKGTVSGNPVTLAKPQTYMNLSGEAVGPLARRYGVRLEDMLVIVDDMDLPSGRLRFRPGGSSGGHNGLKSIMACLGSDAFPRLRIGIGRPAYGVIEHVLSGFDSDRGHFETIIDVAADAVECYIVCGLSEAMNRYNGIIIEE